MHVVKYRESVPWAVWKWGNRSRCSLECWVMWVQRTCITWGCRCPNGKGHFGVSWAIEKHCKAWYLGGW